MAADVIYLNNGGKYRGKIVKETSGKVVIKTRVGKVTVRRDQITRILRNSDLKKQFKQRFEALTSSSGADKAYELGQWAKSNGLKKSARKAYKRAVELDGEHEKARLALKHRKHEGKWYSPTEYKRDVLGLVKHEGKWVTKEDKGRYDAGLVKNKDGVWVLKKKPEETGPPAPRAPRTPRPKASRIPKRPAKSGGQSRRAAPKQEDTSWYRDSTSSGPFSSAPKYESRHYTIKTNVKAEYAKRYGKMMDRYYVKFLKVFKAFMPKGKLRRSEIWIYATRNEFRQVERMGPNTGGFYNTGTKRVTAFHGPFGNTGNTRTVLAHEGTHQFQDLVLGGSFRNAPTWILEGLAVFFESAFYDGKDVVVGLVPRDRLAHLKRGLATNSLIPLSDLIRTPQPRFTAYHYAHAWGLIYMVLYYSEDKKVRKRTTKWFSDLFMAAKKGRVTAEKVEASCGGREKFLELEQRWKEWIRTLPYDYDPTKK